MLFNTSGERIDIQAGDVIYVSAGDKHLAVQILAVGVSRHDDSLSCSFTFKALATSPKLNNNPNLEFYLRNEDQNFCFQQ